jgi:hypothetical protein
MGAAARRAVGLVTARPSGAAARHRAICHCVALGIDGHYAAVLWSHLLWVLPWMLLVLQPAWRRIDPRLILTARTLGWRRAKIFLLLKCPLLVRPALLAFATGFSVSMAQYMPTLWLGAGRFATLTTETVALSSGAASRFSLTGRWDYCWSRARCLVLPPCYPGSRAATDKDYVNAEGKNLTIEPLFREVNFCVPRGEIVTLMGPSGSGNRPFFLDGRRAVRRFQARGELWLDARRCDALPVESRGLGILFQDALLFDQFSVGQNLLLALPERSPGARVGKRSSRRWIPPGWRPLRQRSGHAFRRGARPGQPAARPARRAAGAAAG